MLLYKTHAYSGGGQDWTKTMSNFLKKKSYVFMTETSNILLIGENSQIPKSIVFNL